MGNIDRVIAYRTMRAVEEGRLARPGEKPTRWQRWQAFVYRISDKLTR